MGCPDYIHTDCPACMTRIKFQSKAGKCQCADYTTDAVPMEIAADLDGETQVCPHCQSTVKISIPKTVPTCIAMQTTIGTGKEWD